MTRTARLFADNGDETLSPMRRTAMFKEKNALPRAELHSPIHNRHDLAGAREDHADVRWHVVAAFGAVGEIIGIFRHQPIEKRLQITPCSRIDIFHNDHATTGVLNEYSGCPVSNPAAIDLQLHLIGNFVQAFTFSAKFELLVVDMHYSADY